MMTSCALNDTRAGDGDHLLDRGAKIPSAAGARRSRRAKRRNSPRASRVHPPPVEQAVAAKFAAEEDVLGDRAEGDEIDLLVDRADAAVLRLLGRGELDRLAAEDDLAGVVAVGAGEHLDQRRFAGAVLADQGHHFGRLDLERRGGERVDAHEPLVDIAHGEEGRGLDQLLNRKHIPILRR